MFLFFPSWNACDYRECDNYQLESEYRRKIFHAEKPKIPYRILSLLDMHCVKKTSSENQKYGRILLLCFTFKNSSLSNRKKKSIEKMLHWYQKSICHETGNYPMTFILNDLVLWSVKNKTRGRRRLNGAVM